MDIQSTSSIGELLQERISFRKATLKNVLMGEIQPHQRRLLIQKRRRELLLGEAGDSYSRNGSDDEPEQPTETSQNEEESLAVEPDSKVELEVDSPSEEEIQAANIVAKTHSEAEAIAVREEGTLVVKGSPGGDYRLDVSDTNEWELDEDSDSVTVDGSPPSMSEAAAKARN